MRTAAEIEPLIRAVMTNRKTQGFEVRPGAWGCHGEELPRDHREDPPRFIWRANDSAISGGCMCPMACVILGREHGFDDRFDGCGGRKATAAAVLEITERQVGNFVVGLDESEDDIVDFDHDDFYQLGVKLRGELLTEMGM